MIFLQLGRKRGGESSKLERERERHWVREKEREREKKNMKGCVTNVLHVCCCGEGALEKIHVGQRKGKYGAETGV